MAELIASIAVHARPMTILDYMRQTLTHDLYGYYMNLTDTATDDDAKFWDDEKENDKTNGTTTTNNLEDKSSNNNKMKKDNSTTTPATTADNDDEEDLLRNRGCDIVIRRNRCRE